LRLGEYISKYFLIQTPGEFSPAFRGM